MNKMSLISAGAISLGLLVSTLSFAQIKTLNF